MYNANTSEIERLILQDQAPPGLEVSWLSFNENAALTRLPENLTASTLNLKNCSNLRELPKGLRCQNLDIEGLPLTTLPEDIQIAQQLRLRNMALLQSLPDALRLPYLWMMDCPMVRTLPNEVGGVYISHCVSLERLPPHATTRFLSINGCPNLTILPDMPNLQSLSLENCPAITSLPTGMQLYDLTIENCPDLPALPMDLQVSSQVDVIDCPLLQSLPEGVRTVGKLTLRNCIGLTELPSGLAVRHLDLHGCTALQAIPEGLAVDILDLTGCITLQRLPEKLHVRELILAGCINLMIWPEGGIAGLRNLDLRGCEQITALPSAIQELNQLNITGCTSLKRLPDNLFIKHRLDVAQSGLTALPSSANGFRLRWNGTPISGRAAFHPELLTATEVIEEENAETRRVMIERMGFTRFLQEAQAQLVDEDTDPGGQRQLLRVDLERDEPLVCLALHDPSTARQYVIRVPPTMQTCHQAAAWIAGFDDATRYHPVQET